VLGGREAWQEQETIRRAVVIDNGVILKPEILSFQGRQPQYPHEPLAATLP
jgi:N5-(carboxyethyl)ornithine synthase